MKTPQEIILAIRAYYKELYIANGGKNMYVYDKESEKAEVGNDI